MTKGKVTPEPAVLPSSFDLQRDRSDLFILVKKRNDKKDNQLCIASA